MRVASSSLSTLELALASAILLDQRYPFLRRCVFSAVAVGGTLVFGWSFSRLVSLPVPAGFAIGLTLVTGISWLLFGLGVKTWSGLGWWRCADHCLAAMVVGEFVLTMAAATNLVFAFCLRDHALATSLLNGGYVLASDLAMGAYLASAFGRDGMAHRKTWMLWLFVLNGGAALSALFLFNLNP